MSFEGPDGGQTHTEVGPPLLVATVIPAGRGAFQGPGGSGGGAPSSPADSEGATFAATQSRQNSLPSMSCITRHGQALFTHEPGADPRVKMQPILDDLAFGNALEEQSR